MAIEVNAQEGTITVSDTGVTFRTLLGHAGKAHSTTKRRTWKVVYKNVVIGSVRVKTTPFLQENDDGNADGREAKKGGG